MLGIIGNPSSNRPSHIKLSLHYHIASFLATTPENKTKKSLKRFDASCSNPKINLQNSSKYYQTLTEADCPSI